MATSFSFRINSTLSLSLSAEGAIELTWISPKTGETRTDTCPRIEVVDGPQTVNVSGGQHFGSGGYSCSSLFSKRPTEVTVPTSTSDSFISATSALLDMPGGGLAWIEEYDCIGEGRDWSRLLVWKGGPEEALLSSLRAEQARRRAHAQAADAGAWAARLWLSAESHYDERCAWHAGAPARAAAAAAEQERAARLLEWEQERAERAHMLVPPPKGLRDKRPVPQVL